MVAAGVELSSVRSAFAHLAPRLAQTAGTTQGDARDLEPKLLRRYPSFAAWPADAQLALLCMALAVGPGFHLAGFREALSAAVVPNFRAACLQARLKPGSGMAVDRVNEIAPVMLSNAAVVVDFDMSYSRIYFPADLAADLCLK
jgi:hypothetical protein